jgi:hypothetical protein
VPEEPGNGAASRRWLQSPTRAADYLAIGINLYVGLWRGPTEDQLAELKRHRLRVVCAPNDVIASITRRNDQVALKTDDEREAE